MVSSDEYFFNLFCPSRYHISFHGKTFHVYQNFFFLCSAIILLATSHRRYSSQILWIKSVRKSTISFQKFKYENWHRNSTSKFVDTSKICKRKFYSNYNSYFCSVRTSGAWKRIYAHGEQNFRRLHAPEYAHELLMLFFSSYKTQVEFYLFSIWFI